MAVVTMALRSERGERADNEDALAVGVAGASHFAIVSDGAGGHRRGAEASRRVVGQIETALRAAASSFGSAHLADALGAAHADLQRAQVGVHGPRRMYATAVVLWIDSGRDRALWSSVGDSRLYRIRCGRPELVTADDSVVQRLLERGVLTPEQARVHPMKSQLLAAIGMEEVVQPHTLADPVPLEDADVFLLCTDGWWRALDEADMAGTLADARTPQQWLDAMAELIQARAAPEQDNFSAVAVWVSDLG